MADVVQLSQYRNRAAVRNGFARWQKQFKDVFSIDTRIMDLKDATLLRLAQSDKDATDLLHSLIIGFCGYPQHATFETISVRSQMHVLDVYLLLSDQIHFEVMFRLGWIESFVGHSYSLYQIVTSFLNVKDACWEAPPVLSKGHCDYDDYQKLIEREKQVFIRRLLPSAIEAFNERVG